MERYSGEVVIIGGGLAGIVAALDLLEAGKHVVLLDRDEAEKFGGLARESFGGIFIVGSREQRLAGIKDSPELALRDWLSFGEIAADDVWPRRWAEAYVYRCHPDVSLWLRARGIGFFPGRRSRCSSSAASKPIATAPCSICVLAIAPRHCSPRTAG